MAADDATIEMALDALVVSAETAWVHKDCLYKEVCNYVLEVGLPDLVTRDDLNAYMERKGQYYATDDDGLEIWVGIGWRYDGPNGERIIRWRSCGEELPSSYDLL